MKLFLIVLGTIIVTAALTLWIASAYIFPSEFKPVELSAGEEQVLARKLERMDIRQEPPNREEARAEEPPDGTATEGLEPEPYRENDASRTVTLTERELNGILAKNTDLAKKLAIDLSQDLLSATLLVPVDRDFPILGGQTLKVRGGMELAYRNNRPVAILKGVSVMGVPIPNAWLGDMKNIDLVEFYGDDAGFWKTFAQGVDNIRIQDGSITLKVKE